MRAGARAAPGPGPALALGSPRIRPARQGRRVRCHRGWSSLKDGRSSDTCALRRARGPRDRDRARGSRAARPLRIPAAQLLGASEASRGLVRKSRVLPTRRPSQGTFRQAPGRRAGTRARTGGADPSEVAVGVRRLWGVTSAVAPCGWDARVVGVSDAHHRPLGAALAPGSAGSRGPRPCAARDSGSQKPTIRADFPVWGVGGLASRRSRGEPRCMHFVGTSPDGNGSQVSKPDARAHAELTS